VTQRSIEQDADGGQVPNCHEALRVAIDATTGCRACRSSARRPGSSGGCPSSRPTRGRPAPGGRPSRPRAACRSGCSTGAVRAAGRRRAHRRVWTRQGRRAEPSRRAPAGCWPSSEPEATLVSGILDSLRRYPGDVSSCSVLRR